MAEQQTLEERIKLLENALRLLLEAAENVETMPPHGADPWCFYQDAKAHARAVLREDGNG